MVEANLVFLVKKKTGTNQWDYPDHIRFFNSQGLEPSQKLDLICEYTGSLSIAELDANVSYTIEEYAPPQVPEEPIPRGVYAKDLALLFPQEAFAELKDLSDDKGRGKKDRGAAIQADIILSSGVLLDANSSEFTNLLDWALANLDSFTQDEYDAIMATI